MKLFLNMTSKNGDPVLVSLLQYMKQSRIDNPEIQVKDERIVTLDAVVREVKQSEEWEAVKMSILSIGIEKGERQFLQNTTLKNLKKGMDIPQIAKELETDESVIREIIAGLKLDKDAKGL